MTTQLIEIRRLLPADASLYRDIRLEALRLSPEAFGSAYETESIHPVGWFAERLDRGAVILGAFRGGELAGIVGFIAAEGPKRQHKGMLVGMYVRRQARRAGVGDARARRHAARHGLPLRAERPRVRSQVDPIRP